jgi:hypothetical protein
VTAAPLGTTAGDPAEQCTARRTTGSETAAHRFDIFVD